MITKFLVCLLWKIFFYYTNEQILCQFSVRNCVTRAGYNTNSNNDNIVVTIASQIRVSILWKIKKKTYKNYYSCVNKHKIHFLSKLISQKIDL
jgi:hypothetical protein